MNDATARNPTPTPVAALILEGLYQHRLLSTSQLRALYTPEATVQWTGRLVLRLERRGLVQSVRQPTGRKLAFLTADGIEAVLGAPTTEPRLKQLTREQASGPLQHHTLGVNDVGIAFVQAARDRDDLFGPLSWRHEIAHPIGPPPGRRRPEQLIVDALLTYERHRHDGAIRFEYRFLELDRNTMPTDALAAKLARYTRLVHHVVDSQTGGPPVRFWETRYPVFPGTLLVLDNGTRKQLTRRQRTVLALCAQNPDLQGTPEVQITSCLLVDLQADGPFAPIWRTVSHPAQPVDWLANAPSGEGSSR